MKIRKLLYYKIFIIIIYYGLFIWSTFDFFDQNEKVFPTGIALFVIFTSLYFILFKNKKSLFFYAISALIIPLFAIVSFGFSDKLYWTWHDLDWYYYTCQYVIFIISCLLLLVAVRIAFKKIFQGSNEEFIFIRGKDYFAVVVLFIILISSVSRSIYQYFRISKYYYSQTHTESILPDTAAAVIPVGEDSPNDYDDYDEGDDENTISTYSLASLWESPEDDERIIQDLIVFYIDNFLPLNGQGSLEHINEYNFIYEYFGKTTAEENEEILKSHESWSEHKLYFTNAVKIKNKINRDPVVMKSVFYTYKHLLYKALSRKNYYKADINNYVDILILSYSDINSNSDPEKLLMEIQHISELNPEVYYEKISSVEKLVSEDYKKEYRNIYYGNGSKVRGEDLFWAYTFWSRRNNENNSKEVYDILKEVQNYYSD